MKVCAVIVTYGDRFYLLKQVIDACLKEGIDKIIVVDNASAENSRRQLKEYEKQIDKLKVIYLNENTGSAGGYKRGLQEAYNCEECEYIWLLDDDNMPTKDSLKILKDFWNKYDLEDKEENLCLLSFRPDRVIYKEAIMTNNPNLVLGRKNSFLGFHIIDLPKKVIRVIKRKIGMQTFKENSKIRYGQVAVAPYGGMFFHKKLIGSIGYPKEEFFVYADDHEWSYRVTKKNGKIILVLDSVLEDIEKSEGFRYGNKLNYFQLLLNISKMRSYYSIRNRVFFEKCLLVQNDKIWSLNRFIFLKILAFYVRDKDNKKNYENILKAIEDGENLCFT
ncbi:glycosyltransferase [Caminibacter mediatlanticus TB-2]|uniref:Glycosyltransferase n=1 Tax=Caminibacter mediatlanticus TB-2 TaxID=391592 RepID=A0ABX5V6N9_9BACT|nr:glycosyltransferase [Caminibacter mediatlanticus]QCT93940.1 glycosyltransferase [Caminibacter mediatlanticus TB-2]